MYVLPARFRSCTINLKMDTNACHESVDIKAVMYLKMLKVKLHYCVCNVTSSAGAAGTQRGHVTENVDDCTDGVLE